MVNPDKIQDCSKKKSTQAFTLVELSIVIVIIGLIVAGITAGKSLVRQSKIQQIIIAKNQYEAAVKAFTLQYNALPGDVMNASSYWPACDATPSKCNGNGNRRIESTGADDATEWARFWQHLSLARLVADNYSGVLSSSLYIVNSGAMPDGPIAGSMSSRTSGSAFFVSYQTVAYFSKATTALVLGANGLGTNGSIFDGTALASQETKSIDSKIDDGIANKGKMYAITGQSLTANSCSDLMTGSADYNLSSTAGGCYIAFFIF